MIRPRHPDSSIARDAAWESSIVATFYRLSITPEKGEEDQVSGDWIKAHEAFHQALVSACDNVWMLRVRSILYTQCERYRSLVVVRGDQVGRDLVKEHQEIMDAAVARDMELASALLRNHYNRTSHDWVESLRRKAKTGLKPPVIMVKD